MTDFEEAMMIRASAQGDQDATRWLAAQYRGDIQVSLTRAEALALYNHTPGAELVSAQDKLYEVIESHGQRAADDAEARAQEYARRLDRYEGR